VSRARVPPLYVDLVRVQCPPMVVNAPISFGALQIYLGSLYANDFNLFGRTWQVNVQAMGQFRNKVEDVRRLMVRNKDVGVFCNVAASTLGNSTSFAQCLDFLEANRALAPSLVLEFKQSTFRGLGPAPVLSPQIILIIAREHMNLPRVHLEYPCRQFVDEITIVRNEYHRAREVLQRLQQHVFGPHIQMVRRLIEQKKIAGHHQHPGERVAVA